MNAFGFVAPLEEGVHTRMSQYGLFLSRVTGATLSRLRMRWSLAFRR